MKNGKGKWAAIFLLGLVAFAAGQNMGGTFGNVIEIVGFILGIGGLVEFFKKPKAPITSAQE